MQAIRTEDWDNIFSLEPATRYIEKAIIGEVEAYSKLTNSLLRQIDVPALLTFRLQHLQEEFRDELPTLYRLVSAASTRKKYGKQKTRESVQPAIVTVVAEILAIYSNSLSVWRYIEAMILTTGGTKETTINRFASLHDSVKAVTIRRKLDALALHGLTPLQSWIEYDEAFTMVFDNVNKHMKPRHKTSERTNTMHNLTHAIAVLNRLDFRDLSSEPLVPISQVQPSDILPTAETMLTIREKFIDIVLTVWSQSSDQLAWMAQEPKHHRFSHFTSEKTEKVTPSQTELKLFVCV